MFLHVFWRGLGPAWVPVGIGAAALAAVLWQSWEINRGTYRRVLSSIIGILMAFAAGVITQQAVERFRSTGRDYHWIVDLILGVIALIVSFSYIFERKPPKTFFQLLDERNKPPSIVGNKDTQSRS